MDIRLKFLGGAKSVTGSKYLLTIGGSTIMVDCGLFQGLRETRARNWDDLPIDISEIDAIVITHAHLDHSGYLPKIVKQGYRGPIYMTDPTKELLTILLADSAKLQEEETEYARKKGFSRHAKPLPLYDSQDVELVLPLIRSFSYDSKFSIAKHVSCNFKNAGHILGSAIVELSVRGEEQDKVIAFSGDIGRYENPMHQDPGSISYADILFVESTYGDTINPTSEIEKSLENVINQDVYGSGCLLIPAFSLGRTQALLYYLKKLMAEKKIPSLPIYIDSPMAINVTQLYKDYPSYHKLSESSLKGAKSLFDFENIHYYRSSEASASLNNIKKNAIIISASGMCSGGRILHHLYHRLSNINDTVLFVGFQAEGTRGERILNQEATISIFGQDVPLKCKVRQIDGLSAHADKNELLTWLKNFESKPKRVFIVHGEEKAAISLKKEIKTALGWEAIVPNYLESFMLFENI